MFFGLPDEESEPVQVAIMAPSGRELLSFFLDEKLQIPREGETIFLQADPNSDVEEEPQDGSYTVREVSHNFRRRESSPGRYVIYVFVEPAEDEPPMDERDWNEPTPEEIEELYADDDRITDDAVEE